MNFAFPDVCLTPIPTPAGPVPTPIPYPNTAMGNTAIPNVLNILVGAMPAHNLMTITPVSNGDNSGVNMNPMSGMVMGPSKHMMGSVKTLFGGLPVTKMLSPTGQNGMSPGAFGASLVPSQIKVLALA